MSLQKQISYDHSITELGQVQVRQIIRAIENGKEIAKTYHRDVLNPGENVEDQDERSKKIAQAIWTPKVIREYKEKMAENELDKKNVE